MKKTLLTILSLAALSLAGAHAQVLSWDMQGVAGNSTTVTAQSIAGNLETSSELNTLARVGVIANTLGNSFNSNTWNLSNTFNENEKYITFSLTPVSGFQITATSLSYAINGTTRTPNTSRWGYKIGSGSFVTQPTFTLGTTTPTLSSWNFDDFTTTETIEFRFWTYGDVDVSATAPTNAGAARITSITGNDLVLNGSVTAVPEPSTIAFLGFASVGLCFFLWRRRRA